MRLNLRPTGKQAASKRGTVLRIPPRIRGLTRDAAFQYQLARRLRPMTLPQNTTAAALSVANVIVPKAQGCSICPWRALFVPPHVYCLSPTRDLQVRARMSFFDLPSPDYQARSALREPTTFVV